jgi:hypothetical protein
MSQREHSPNRRASETNPPAKNSLPAIDVLAVRAEARADLWWKLTPLEPEREAPKRSHRTPQSTIDAFWYVVRSGDTDRLTRWLEQHPANAPELHEIW